MVGDGSGVWGGGGVGGGGGLRRLMFWNVSAEERVDVVKINPVFPASVRRQEGAAVDESRAVGG